MGGGLLPPGGRLAAAPGGPVSGPGTAHVAVHRLSHCLGAVAATIAGPAGAGALGTAPRAAVRGRHLARFSADGDAGHPGDVVQKEMRFLRGGHLRLLPVAALFLSPAVAAADGGTIRLSEQKGNYRITVFTSPTLLRAGPLDI